MKNTTKNIGITLIIVFICLFIVAIFEIVLQKNINEALEKEKFSIRKAVFAEADFFDENKVLKAKDVIFIPAYTNNKLVGYVSYGNVSGFSSKISFVLGIDLDGKIKALKVLDASKETSGLGTKISNLSWENLWKGRDKSYSFDKKVDALTGATITPKSVYLGIKAILNAYGTVKPLEINAKEPLVKAIEKVPEAITIKKDNSNLLKDPKILQNIITVFTNCDGFEKLHASGLKLYLCYDNNSKKLGYFAKIKVDGVDDFITFDLATDMDGKILKVLNLSTGNNASSYNEKVNSSSWQDHFIGKDINYTFDDTIDSVSGASVSPRVIYDGIMLALDSIKNR